MLGSPQFLYIVLVLPVLFGLTIMGEGISKLIKNDWTGMISVFFGIGFIAVAVIVYFFSSRLIGESV